MICVVKPSANSESKVKIQGNLTNIQLAALPAQQKVVIQGADVMLEGSRQYPKQTKT